MMHAPVPPQGGGASASAVPGRVTRRTEAIGRMRTAAASASLWRRLRLAGGGLVLVVLVWRVGAGPFLDGVRSLNPLVLGLAIGVGALTTVCCAWRWRVVAEALGMRLSMRAAIPAYYRSQFLNTTLPGGVIGDVHRAVRHGRDIDDVGGGLRAVWWERVCGYLAHVILTVLVLAALPWPTQPWALDAVVLGVCLLLAIAAVLVARAHRRRAPRRSSERVRGESRAANAGRWSRLTAAAADDIRAGVLARGVWPKVAFASAVVAIGHTATFVVAAAATGTAAPVTQLLPIAVLVLLASGLPLSIAGWGPREGMAAWMFGAAGLGAAQGVAASTAFGVMGLVATVPGALALLAGGRRRRRGPGQSTWSEVAVAGAVKGVAGG